MSTITIPSLAVENPFSLQGAMYMCKRASGVYGPWWWVGNSPKSDFAPNVTRRNHRESYSGNRQIDRTRISSRDAKLTATLEDINKDNIAAGLLGNKVTTAGGSVSAEAMPTMAVGQVYKLKYPNASSIVITDSAGSPGTLTANTHYKVLNAKTGLIEILSLGSFTQPFKAAYTAAAVSVITGMTGDDADEFGIYYDLLNTEPATDQAIGFEIYRAQIDPTKLLALINAEGGSFDLEATVLRDLTKAADSEFGGYFRWIYNDANLS
jgi:hypothetical protein